MLPKPAMDSSSGLRDIFEQEKFAAQLKNLGISAKRLDDVMAGLGITIAKHPERFATDEKTGWHRVVIREFPPDIPRIRIWFTHDDNCVYLEAAERMDVEEA